MIDLLRRFATILWDFVPLAKVFPNKLSKHFNYYFKITLQVFSLKENNWKLLLWLVFIFMVSFSSYGFSIKSKIALSNTRDIFFAIITFALRQSISFFHNLYVKSRLFCFIHLYSNAFANPKKTITSKNCGTQTLRNNLVGHKKGCSIGTLYSTNCPNSSTTSQPDLKYRIAKKHGTPKPVVAFLCEFLSSFFKILRFMTTLNHSTWLSHQENNRWSWRYHQGSRWQ